MTHSENPRTRNAILDGHSCPPSYNRTPLTSQTTDHIRPTMDTANGDAGTHTRKILFLTNSESGQANTILALALEALTRPHVEVHIASFPTLRRRVERLSPNLNFHALDGKGMSESVPEMGLTEDMFPHPPTRKGLTVHGRSLGQVLAGWDGKCTFCSFSRCRWYI